MQVRLQQVFPVFVLAVLTAGSIWLERATRSPDEEQATQILQGPDIIVEQMAVTRFDINGTPHYYLDARTMTHLPYDAHSRLTDAVVHLVRSDMDMRWSSNRALAQDDGARVDLIGHVRGERAVPKEATTYFSSETLTVWPDTESAQSNTPVTITQDGAVAKGNRMTADNIFGNITLIGQVHTHMPIKRKSP